MSHENESEKVRQKEPVSKPAFNKELKERYNITLKPSIKAHGEQVALKRDLSFSSLIEQLLRKLKK